MEDELLEIADDATNDWMEKRDRDGEAIGWMVNGEHIQRSRVRIDTRKWIMSKRAPKKYGDRVSRRSRLKATPRRVPHGAGLQPEAGGARCRVMPVDWIGLLAIADRAAWLQHGFPPIYPGDIVALAVFA